MGLLRPWFWLLQTNLAVLMGNLPRVRGQRVEEIHEVALPLRGIRQRWILLMWSERGLYSKPYFELLLQYVFSLSGCNMVRDKDCHLRGNSLWTIRANWLTSGLLSTVCLERENEGCTLEEGAESTTHHHSKHSPSLLKKNSDRYMNERMKEWMN